MTRHNKLLFLTVVIHAVFTMATFTLFYVYGYNKELAEAAREAGIMTAFTGVFHLITWNWILKKMATDAEQNLEGATS